MSQTAFISFVEGSSVSSVNLDEIKQQLLHYQEQTALTGKQLGWEYAESAFPYTIETKPEAEDQWFYLKGKNPLYKYILFGTGEKIEGESEKHFVQVVLPDNATHGDKAKGNEFCKYLAKTWQGELQLFNGRVMYFYPRK